MLNNPPKTLQEFKLLDRRTDKEKEIQQQIDNLQKQLREESSKRRANELEAFRAEFNGKYVQEVHGSRSPQPHIVRYRIDNVKFVGCDNIECEGVGYEFSDADLYDPLEKQSLFSFRFYDSGTIRVDKTAAFITEAEYTEKLAEYRKNLDEYVDNFIAGKKNA